MSKTIKTVLAILGALTAICAVLLILKKKFGCKKCCCKKDGDCGCEPETVEDFVEEATDAAQEKVEEAKDTAAAIAEEFKDYADVELPEE